MKRNLKKYFLISLISTLFILFLITGFLAVEKNTQAVIFETNASFFEFKYDESTEKYLKIHFMGKDFVLNFNFK